MSSFISDNDINLVENKPAKMMLRCWRRFAEQIPYKGIILQMADLIVRAEQGRPVTELTSDMREWKYIPGVNIIYDSEPYYINRRCPAVMYKPSTGECIHREHTVYWYHIGRGQRVYYTDSTSNVKIQLPYQVPSREACMKYKLPDNYTGQPQDINGFISVNEKEVTS